MESHADSIPAPLRAAGGPWQTVTVDFVSFDRSVRRSAQRSASGVRWLSVHCEMCACARVHCFAVCGARACVKMSCARSSSVKTQPVWCFEFCSLALRCVVLAGGRGCATARQARDALSCARPPRERRRAVGALRQLAMGPRSDAAACTTAWRNHPTRLSNVRGPPARPAPPLPALLWLLHCFCLRWRVASAALPAVGPGTAVLCCGHLTWASSQEC